MSTYRNLDRMRHCDEKLIKCGAIAKAVWDYLCCNHQDHASGIYKLSVAAACEDTGWTTEQFAAALEELEAAGLIEWDPSVRLVWVRNMLAKAKYRSPQQIKYVKTWMSSLPKSDLVGRMAAYYRQRYDIDLGFSNSQHILDTLSDTLCDRVLSVSVSDSVSVSESVGRDLATAVREARKSGRIPRHTVGMDCRERQEFADRMAAEYGVDEVIGVIAYAWEHSPDYARGLFNADGKCFLEQHKRYVDAQARKVTAPTLPTVAEERSHVTPEEAEAAMARLGWHFDDTGKLVTNG